MAPEAVEPASAPLCELQHWEVRAREQSGRKGPRIIGGFFFPINRPFSEDLQEP